MGIESLTRIWRPGVRDAGQIDSAIELARAIPVSLLTSEPTDLPAQAVDLIRYSHAQRLADGVPLCPYDGGDRDQGKANDNLNPERRAADSAGFGQARSSGQATEHTVYTYSLIRDIKSRGGRVFSSPLVRNATLKSSSSIGTFG